MQNFQNCAIRFESVQNGYKVSNTLRKLSIHVKKGYELKWLPGLGQGLLDLVNFSDISLS